METEALIMLSKLDALPVLTNLFHKRNIQVPVAKSSILSDRKCTGIIYDSCGRLGTFILHVWQMNDSKKFIEGPELEWHNLHKK